jgi:hypothetical protein
MVTDFLSASARLVRTAKSNRRHLYPRRGGKSFDFAYRLLALAVEEIQEPYLTVDVLKREPEDRGRRRDELYGLSKPRCLRPSIFAPTPS